MKNFGRNVSISDVRYALESSWASDQDELGTSSSFSGMLLHSLGVCTLYSVRPCRNLPFTDTLSLGCLQHAGLLSTIFGVMMLLARMRKSGSRFPSLQLVLCSL